MNLLILHCPFPRYPTSSVFREHYRNVLPQLNHLAKRSMLMQCFCYYNKKVRSSGEAWLPPALAPHARIADTRCARLGLTRRQTRVDPVRCGWISVPIRDFLNDPPGGGEGVQPQSEKKAAGWKKKLRGKPPPSPIDHWKSILYKQRSVKAEEGSRS